MTRGAFRRWGGGLVPPDSTGGPPRSFRVPQDHPVSGCEPAWTAPGGGAYLPPCSSTRRSSLPMASGPPDAMVVLLEQLTSDLPGAPGRQGPGRLSSSGPCRPGAAPDHQEPLMTAIDMTGARTTEAADVITGARERIDALDDRIIGLIQERVAVSAVIQEARIASGGRRVNLSREMDVLGHYREALGKPGTALAMTLLELCRGKI
ncbi:chorismate mutase [Streptomyces sp. FXY-T5]|uniref:chorismate mutase n=1 Tax=Streptomyces sp. FXY-T5 TaxID=3064901 RepID=UPI0027D2665C|nr:chorismate mutase [Streptomyces sp. FXY-T5]WMD03656.1 chorismate mutase [Streptomyces sp. FXY-T5]